MQVSGLCLLLTGLAWVASCDGQVCQYPPCDTTTTERVVTTMTMSVPMTTSGPEDTTVVFTTTVVVDVTTSTALGLGLGIAGGSLLLVFGCAYACYYARSRGFRLQLVRDEGYPIYDTSDRRNRGYGSSADIVPRDQTNFDHRPSFWSDIESEDRVTLGDQSESGSSMDLADFTDPDFVEALRAERDAETQV